MSVFSSIALLKNLSNTWRLGDYKWSFAEQRMAGTMGVWAEPFTKLREGKRNSDGTTNSFITGREKEKIILFTEGTFHYFVLHFNDRHIKTMCRFGQ